MTPPPEKYKLEANIKIASEPNDLIDAYYDLIQFYEQHSLSKTTNQRDLLKQFCLNKTIRSDETAKQNKKYIDSCRASVTVEISINT